MKNIKEGFERLALPELGVEQIGTYWYSTHDFSPFNHFNHQNFRSSNQLKTWDLT